MESSKEYFDYDIDHLSLPHEIFDIFSELKSKREKEKENEIKFKSLIEEKIVLEKQFDDLKMKYKILENDNKLKLEELMAKNLTSSVSKDEKLKRQKIMLETNDQEINHLRNEICRLQLANFSTERKKNDQEKELQQISSQLQSCAREKKEFENKFNNINEKFRKVLGEVSQLELEIKEAIRINLLYSEENKKVQSEMSKVKNTYHCTQSQLYHANAKLKKLSLMKNCNSEDNISGYQKEIKALKENNTTLKDMVTNKENIINEYSNQFKNSQINVEKLNRIVCENSLEVKEFKEKLAEKENQLKCLQEEHDNVKKLKDIEKDKHATLEREFSEKLNDLENQVSSLKASNNELKSEKQYTTIKVPSVNQPINVDDDNPIDTVVAPTSVIDTTDIITTTVISTNTTTSTSSVIATTGITASTTVISANTTTTSTSNYNDHLISSTADNIEKIHKINDLTIEKNVSNDDKYVVEIDKNEGLKETNNLIEVEIAESPDNRITYQSQEIIEDNVKNEKKSEDLAISEKNLKDGEKSDVDSNKENIHSEEIKDSASIFERFNENKKSSKENGKVSDKTTEVTVQVVEKSSMNDAANPIKTSEECDENTSKMRGVSQNSQTLQTPSKEAPPLNDRTPVESSDKPQKMSHASETNKPAVSSDSNHISTSAPVTSSLTSINPLLVTVPPSDKQSTSTQNTLNKISEIFYSSISNVARFEPTSKTNSITSPIRTLNTRGDEVNKDSTKGTKRPLEDDIVSRYKRTLGLATEWKKPYIRTTESVSTSSETKPKLSYISSLSTIWSLAKEDSDKLKERLAHVGSVLSPGKTAAQLEDHKSKSLQDITNKNKVTISVKEVEKEVMSEEEKCKEQSNHHNNNNTQ